MLAFLPKKVVPSTFITSITIAILEVVERLGITFGSYLGVNRNPLTMKKASTFPQLDFLNEPLSREH